MPPHASLKNQITVVNGPDADNDILKVVVACRARQILEADQQFFATRCDAGQDLIGVAWIEGREGVEDRR